MQMEDADDYKCKHCDARPYTPGPHHNSSCPRYSLYAHNSLEDAYEHDCKHCNARPYTPGSHHKESCPRYERTMFHNDIKRPIPLVNPDELDKKNLTMTHIPSSDGPLYSDRRGRFYVHDQYFGTLPVVDTAYGRFKRRPDGSLDRI